MQRSIGQCIHDQRIARGLSRDDVSYLSGLSVAYLGRLESDRLSTVPPYTLLLVANALDTTIDDLLESADRAAEHVQNVEGAVQAAAGLRYYFDCVRCGRRMVLLTAELEGVIILCFRCACGYVSETTDVQVWRWQYANPPFRSCVYARKDTTGATNDGNKIEFQAHEPVGSLLGLAWLEKHRAVAVLHPDHGRLRFYQYSVWLRSWQLIRNDVEQGEQQ